jgi:diguanylate cyclase (GGDEF)-like protein
LIDIDHFKRINDVYGHAIGDQALVAVATACQSRLRSTDLFARWGGEEFLVFLNEHDAKSAWRVAEDLRKAVEAVKLSYPLSITISIGIGICTDVTSTNFDRLLSVADHNLYEAKRQGRNRSVLVAA